MKIHNPIICFSLLFLFSFTSPATSTEDFENSVQLMTIQDIRQLTNGLSSDEDKLRKLVKQNLLKKYLLATQLYPEAISHEVTTLCRIQNVFVAGQDELHKSMNLIFSRSFEEFSKTHEIEISKEICEALEISSQTVRKPNFRKLDHAIKELNESEK
ncbi:MAG: hypothetical protein ACI9SP_004189 [Arenicella sp.]|jgi:hypothetical protein